MAYTDFIAAIDLGSSHMVGMVGTKGMNNSLSIIAYEVETSDACIRRGCVYNIKETASKIKRLILKLENKLGGSKIDKIYIGVGGQSLRTINHSISRVIGEGVVTEDILQLLHDECKLYHPDMLEVFQISDPVYLLDNKEEQNPLGLTCSRIEARYKLLVGRPSLKHVLVNSLPEQIKLKIAGVIVSPLALADLILTEREKETGCALIDFGAGVTSVTLFKNGKLVGMSVIPLGSQLITKDLMSLNIQEKEAERIKRTYGNAIWEKDEDQQMVTVDLADGNHTREIKLSEVNIIVDARSREIIENIYARLEEAGVSREPGFSIVIAGNGAALKNMREAIVERFKMDVRYASVRKDKIESGEMIANNPEYTMASALLLQGNQNCALVVEKTAPEAMKKEVVVENAFVEESLSESDENAKEESAIKPSALEEQTTATAHSGSKSGATKGEDKHQTKWKILDIWADKMNTILKED